MTDALHNVADLTASFASWFGLRISQRKPTERFRYGYYKAESLATLAVSIFILYAAFELLLEGYARLYIVSEPTMPFETLGTSLISAVVSYLLANYMRKAGEKVNSQSLKANAQERTTHVLTSSVISVGILLTFLRVPYVEGVLTLVFSLVIFKTGIFAAKDSVFALMDVSPSKDVEDRVKEIIKSIAGVEAFENLKLRKSGPFVFGEVSVKIRKSVDVKRAHEIAGSIERKIREELMTIDSFTVHIEPFKAKTHKLVIPVKQNRDLDSEIADRFGRANYFVFVTVDEQNEKSVYIRENPHSKDSIQAGFKAVNFIVKEKIDVLIAKSIGGISFHTLRDHLVDIYQVEGGKAGIAVDNYVGGTLEPLTEPTDIDRS